MKTLNIENRIIFIFELGKAEWSKDFPSHLTYSLDSVGKVSEPIYTPFWDEEGGERHTIYHNKILGVLKELQDENLKELLASQGIVLTDNLLIVEKL